MLPLRQTRPGERPPRAESQILVLGMPGCGASVLARLLRQMGSYVGPEESLVPASSENPRGSCERKDVVELNSRILESLGVSLFRAVEPDFDSLEPERRSELERSARDILEALEPHRPWVLKDPRMCLALPLWRRLLSRPICVLIHRNPVMVAKSLATRDALPMPYGLAMWERYSLSALDHSRGLARLLVSFQQLLEDPLAVMKQLHHDLLELGMDGLRLPERETISAIVDRDLENERADPELENAYLNPAQARLFQALESGKALDWEEIPALSLPSHDLLLSLDRNPFELIAQLQRQLEESGRWGQGLFAAVEERDRTIRRLQNELEKTPG